MPVLPPNQRTPLRGTDIYGGASDFFRPSPGRLNTNPNSLALPQPAANAVVNPITSTANSISSAVLPPSNEASPSTTPSLSAPPPQNFQSPTVQAPQSFDAAMASATPDWYSMAAGQNFTPAQMAQYGPGLGGAYPSDPAGRFAWFQNVASALNYNATGGLPMDIPYLVGIGAQAPTSAQTQEMKQKSTAEGWYQKSDGTWSNPQMDELYGGRFSALYAPPGFS